MKTLDVEVTDIRKVTGDGNLKAFADVKVGGNLTIKGVCVMRGKKGLFVSMPRKASKDGRWFDILEAEAPLWEHIEERVMGSYEREMDGARA
jgi:stage V sporulation protein G